MAEMKTPGVYIVEKNAFPNLVVEVATAVPGFVGYTEKAMDGAKSLRLTPWRIASMSEFIQYFGAGPTPLFGLAPRDEADGVPLGPLEGATVKGPGAPGPAFMDLKRRTPAFALYDAMRLFFRNGGGACYIVSCGGYEDEIAAGRLLDGLKALESEPEPTLLVVPETTRLTRPESAKIQRAMLAQCGATRSRFAILDLPRGWRGRDDEAGDPVEAFRGDIGVTSLDFGAAYYPWVRTTIHTERDFSFENIAPDEREALAGLLKSAPLAVKKDSRAAALVEIDRIAKASPEEAAGLDRSLRALSPLYGAITAALADAANVAPPGAAMAGIYTLMDNSRGVWKAPANVSMNSVAAPAVSIDREMQEDLNVAVSGRSINAIRSFIGEGVLVWGARTLDGNSLDWRYINVRRTMIMIEQSIVLAAKAYVFEPNDANTWATMRSMIGNFLTGIWKRGGLAGSTPEDAFSVHVGLGETMTSADILEGRLIMTVLVAVTRPAEFIEITFQQQMQKS